MPRYVAFLRGVSPINLKMPDLKLCCEDAGFGNVKTLRSSGNVAFDASSRSQVAVARKLEAAMSVRLGRSFMTFARRTTDLQKLVDEDPWAAFDLPPEAKRIVTFLQAPLSDTIALPPEKDGARMLAVVGGEVFSAYVPHAGSPAFMTVIEKTLGKNVTTRTLGTVGKCANA
ncbi:MAG TPA: DUF1697 domain-containing protein [Oleiagrimonas sp.]|nr:DUF1697 domain-containing protein [Oleiagrimonas sp.]